MRVVEYGEQGEKKGGSGGLGGDAIARKLQACCDVWGGFNLCLKVHTTPKYLVLATCLSTGFLFLKYLLRGCVGEVSSFFFVFFPLKIYVDVLY